MSISTRNPRTIEELKKYIDVVEDGYVPTGYVVELVSRGEIEIRRYKNGEEIYEDRIENVNFFYEDFESFIKELKSYTGNKKVYLSFDYAVIILAALNGGYPEDYE